MAHPTEASCFAALVVAPWFGRLQTLSMMGCPLGTAESGDGAGVRALAAPPPQPHLAEPQFACLSAADVSGVLSSAPWLATLTSLELSYNDQLGTPGHCALSLLHLPRLRALSLCTNGLCSMGLAALATAPWLTQLTPELTMHEAEFASTQSFEEFFVALDDDAWVFGRLRRLGCSVRYLP